MKHTYKITLLVVILIAFAWVNSTYGQLRSNANPEIVAHRGASFIGPENTLVAMQLAIRNGADAVELDIHLTKDKKIVLHHDANIKRFTGRDKEIRESFYADIKDLDYGSHAGPAFEGEKMALLSEVLDWLPEGKQVYIEIKAKIEIVPELTKLLLDHPKRKQFRVIAFDYDTLREFKTLNSDIPCYFLSSSLKKENREAFLEKIALSNFDGADLHYAAIDKSLVDLFHANEMKILTWTVNSVAEATRLSNINVDGITTDRPGFFQKE